MSTPAYEFYDAFVSEERDEGLLQIPVAGPPGTPCEIVRQHAPVGQCVVQYVVASRGGAPEVPAAKSLTPADGYVLARSFRGAKFLVPTAANSVVWAVEGWYLYYMVLPRDVDTDFPVAHIPGALNLLGGTPEMVAAAQYLTGLLASRRPAPPRPPTLQEGIAR